MNAEAMAGKRGAQERIMTETLTQLAMEYSDSLMSNRAVVYPSIAIVTGSANVRLGVILTQHSNGQPAHERTPVEGDERPAWSATRHRARIVRPDATRSRRPTWKAPQLRRTIGNSTSPRAGCRAYGVRETLPPTPHLLSSAVQVGTIRRSRTVRSRAQSVKRDSCPLTFLPDSRMSVLENVNNCALKRARVRSRGSIN